MVFIVFPITICTSIGALPTNSKSFCFVFPFFYYLFCFLFFILVKFLWQQVFHSLMHLFQLIDMHWEKIATFIPYSWGVEKTMIYIIFHDCLNTFDWFSTKAISTQVCRIINENWNFQVKNRILLNIFKNQFFFFFLIFLKITTFLQIIYLVSKMWSVLQ